MKTKTPKFHLKGYERVMAIHKLKQSINKFGDKLGKKNKILNDIKRKSFISKDFIDLTINKINLDFEKRLPYKINLINKKIQNNEEDYKNETPIKKQRIKTGLISNTLKDENLKIDNEKDLLNNSYDSKIKESDVFSNLNKSENSNNQISNEHTNINYLIQNLKNNNPLKKSKTYSDFNKLLKKDILSNEHKKQIDYQEPIPIIKPLYIKNRRKINYRNKTIIAQFRSLKLGTKPMEMKLKCKVIKLDKNISQDSIKKNILNDMNIKKRILFYNKYKKTKDMKLTKIKVSKSKNDIFENEIFSYKKDKGDNILIKDNTKNFGQQTINGKLNKTQLNHFNLLRIYSYIRLPNINRINYPHEKLNLDKNCGINFDFYNNNYFYLKDIKNQSINKIFMINPFIRNRIINN